MRKQKNKTRRKYKLKKIKTINQVKIKKAWVNKSVTKRKEAKIKKKVLLRYKNTALFFLYVTFFRRNVFLKITNIRREIKMCFTAGRYGFQGKNKIASMAITETTLHFLKLVWKTGIRRLIIVYNGYHIGRRAFRKGWNLSRKTYGFKLLGIVILLRTSFNGNKRKKRRRL